MKKRTPSVDLGVLQSVLQDSAAELRSAQAAYLKAFDRLQLAEEKNQQATIALNQGMTTLKSAVHVTPLAAK